MGTMLLTIKLSTTHYRIPELQRTSPFLGNRQGIYPLIAGQLIPGTQYYLAEIMAGNHPKESKRPRWYILLADSTNQGPVCKPPNSKALTYYKDAHKKDP